MCHITKSGWTSNRLPNSDQVRDTGQITQLADMVLMIIRNRKKGVYYKNFATLGVMENRKTGKTGMINLKLIDELFVVLSPAEKVEVAQLYEDDKKGGSADDFDIFTKK
jgi:hypothetical protein